MESPISNVAIVGGGITGPALAIELLNAGIKSTIYEARPQNYDIGGSMVLTPNALLVTSRCGVYDELCETSWPHDTVQLMNLKGDALGSIVVGSVEKYGKSGLRMYRSTLRNTLLAEAARRGIEIVYDRKCASVKENPHSATVEFEDGTSIDADMVIGADGVWSRIHPYLNPDSQPKFSGQMAVLAMAPRNLIADPEEAIMFRLLIDKQGNFAHMPANSQSGNQSVLFFSTFEVPDRDRDGWRKIESDTEGLKAMMQVFDQEGWPETARTLVTKTPAENFFSWPFHTVRLYDQWVSKTGRIAVLGDAAHAIPPSAGQGAGMSLEDASTLAITLGQINQKGLDLASGLGRWEEHRKARIERVVERTQAKSNQRKNTKDDAEQAEKEKRMRAAKDDDDLFWLYGYDVEAMSLE
ncbi:hypothetical protein BP6252_07616 [Coleophoma cylindrospora]|uniref:FAD-binding domain-containing protein n=1 Tax=Coleophoma cylindrospora TaxID=1849047 RepID=A0A3D8RAH6_9HELO|nr:hypothetical protein BP6252_07616 [Coleophoma cylindrospora]